jgi:hypothetical protein
MFISGGALLFPLKVAASAFAGAAVALAIMSIQEPEPALDLALGQLPYDVVYNVDDAVPAPRAVRTIRFVSSNEFKSVPPPAGVQRKLPQVQPVAYWAQPLPPPFGPRVAKPADPVASPPTPKPSAPEVASNPAQRAAFIFVGLICLGSAVAALRFMRSVHRRAYALLDVGFAALMAVAGLGDLYDGVEPVTKPLLLIGAGTFASLRALDGWFAHHPLTPIRGMTVPAVLRKSVFRLQRIA